MSAKTPGLRDACRHFVWAALLVKEFGVEFSSKVLNAHERDPKQPENQRRMDLTNNKLGQAKAELLLKQKRFSEEEIIKEFEKSLNNGGIVVLKKSR